MLTALGNHDLTIEFSENKQVDHDNFYLFTMAYHSLAG
jgi:hypothetical protein